MFDRQHARQLKNRSLAIFAVIALSVGVAAPVFASSMDVFISAKKDG